MHPPMHVRIIQRGVIGGKLSMTGCPPESVLGHRVCFMLGFRACSAKTFRVEEPKFEGAIRKAGMSQER